MDHLEASRSLTRWPLIRNSSASVDLCLNYVSEVTTGMIVMIDKRKTNTDNKSASVGTFWVLPTELQAQVLVDVSFADLAAFRLTCREACRILAAGEVVHQWSLRHTDPS